jgi:hypothetical protein
MNWTHEEIIQHLAECSTILRVQAEGKYTNGERVRSIERRISLKRIAEDLESIAGALQKA